VLKKKVAEAAFITSMLYSSESWLTKDLSHIEYHYYTLIKTLLGVHATTTNLLCLMEAGLSDLPSLVEARRAAFLKSKLQDADNEEPFIRVYELCRRNNTPGYRICTRSMNNIQNNNVDSDRIREYARKRTKFATYMEFNPQLSVCPIYNDALLPEHHRIAATRFRLSSHELLIEKLRWSRVPRDRRICPCDSVSVQTEYHVISDCLLTQDLRRNLRNVTLPLSLHEMFIDNHYRTICEYIHSILKIF
jgi:hypothetical protein